MGWVSGCSSVGFEVFESLGFAVSGSAKGRKDPGPFRGSIFHTWQILHGINLEKADDLVEFGAWDTSSGDSS